MIASVCRSCGKQISTASTSAAESSCGNIRHDDRSVAAVLGIEMLRSFARDIGDSHDLAPRSIVFPGQPVIVANQSGANQSDSQCLSVHSPMISLSTGGAASGFGVRNVNRSSSRLNGELAVAIATGPEVLHPLHHVSSPIQPVLPVCPDYPSSDRESNRSPAGRGSARRPADSRTARRCACSRASRRCSRHSRSVCIRFASAQLLVTEMRRSGSVSFCIHHQASGQGP